MDRMKFQELLERSSLSDPDAQAMRRRTPRAVANEISQKLSATNKTSDGIGAKHQPEPFLKEELTMSKPSDRHVVPNPDGGWDVRKPGADRVSSHHDTQADAIGRGREIVGNAGGGEVVIHGRDGRIRDSDTVAPGNDPMPPRDRK